MLGIQQPAIQQLAAQRVPVLPVAGQLGSWWRGARSIGARQLAAPSLGACQLSGRSLVV